MPSPAETLAGTDLADSRGLDEAASFVVDLLERPASQIRVAEGQLDLEHDLVVEGHPDTFELTSLSPVSAGTIWAVDGGSCMLADGRSFHVAAFRAARVRFSEGVTDLIESPPLEVRALSRDEMQRLYRERLESMGIEVPERVPDIPRPVDFFRECADGNAFGRPCARLLPATSFSSTGRSMVARGSRPRSCERRTARRWSATCRWPVW